MANLDGSERVLCAPADVVECPGRWVGFRAVDDRAAAAGVVLERAEFLPRTEGLEHGREGLAWRQIIPYVLLRRAGTDSVFVYRRPAGGGDARLRGRLTFGLGGHVNPEDVGPAASFNPPWAIGDAILANCIGRELGQEVGLGSLAVAGRRLVGLINDEGDDVGRRHLGLVYVVDTAAEVVPVRLEVEEGGWHAPEGIWGHPADDWEGWSRILAPHAGAILSGAFGGTH